MQKSCVVVPRMPSHPPPRPLSRATKLQCKKPCRGTPHAVAPLPLDHSPLHKKTAMQKTMSWYPACRRNPPPRPLSHAKKMHCKKLYRGTPHAVAPLALDHSPVQKNCKAKNCVVVPRMPSHPSPLTTSPRSLRKLCLSLSLRSPGNLRLLWLHTWRPAGPG